MNLKGCTVLITGGSEGVGFALAQMLAPDNKVIICGRSEQKLVRAKEICGDLHTEVCDVTNEIERRALVERVLRLHPQLNVLINNAGAKRHTDLLGDDGLGKAMAHDMALNFEAPVALCTELLPHFRSRPRAAIVNITSGLVYLAKAEQAFYCAAKAALHSYTQSLRWALRGSTVDVIEVYLTLVNTNFHQGNTPRNIPSISPAEAASLTLGGIRRGKKEIYIGKASLARWLSVLAPDKGLRVVNQQG